MRKSNVMIKMACMVFMLLLFYIGQVCAAECGDVNSNGDISIVDALLVAQFYVNLDPENFDSSVADVNGDNDIDIVDALLIAQYYVQLITSFPGCTQTSIPTTTSTPVSTNPPAKVTLQAEDAYWNSGTVESEHSGYTGSGYANTANEVGSYIEWTFTASTGENAECVFTYANGSANSRPMELAINGSTVQSNLEFPGPGNDVWDDWRTVSASVYLYSGSNTVRLTSLTSEGGPNLDKLDITFSGIIGTPETTPTPVSTPIITSPPTTGDIYASPSGKSSNGGTSFSDALDIRTALGRVSAGETLLLEAGTYKISYSSGNKNSISLTRNGSSSKLIRVEGFNGQAKLDFQCPDGDWVQDSFGFDLRGDYWYFKNIDITRSPYHGVYVIGAHNTFEDCNFYDNRTTGFEINKGGSYTTVINCDSYDNYDPKRNGGMADGFASKQTQGAGNKFIGCNAWGNSDDGYDTYDSSLTVVFENCTGNNNGTHDGNGNGFKLGGNGVTAIQYLTNCIANNNRKHGFHANGNPGPIYLKNCSASGNGENNYNGDFVIQ